jgi:hypothetical protein
MEKLISFIMMEEASMTIIDYLLDGDPAVRRLTQIYLLEQPATVDDCVVAMMVSLLVYGRFPAPAIDDMIGFLTRRQHSDGGWNCQRDSQIQSKSSIHTTLSVLEAYDDYEKEGYSASLATVREQSERGREYLLRKKLMRRESNSELILPNINQFHFPARWK